MKKYTISSTLKSMEAVKQVVSGIDDIEKSIRLVGSVAVHGEGNDIDFAVLDLKRKLTKSFMKKSGWHATSGDNGYSHSGNYTLVDDKNFVSYRKDDINLLVCHNQKEYDRFVKGAEYAGWYEQLGFEATKAMRVFLCLIAAGESEDKVKQQVKRYL